MRGVAFAPTDLKFCSCSDDTTVGRCRLTPGGHHVDRTWFQRFKLRYDDALSNSVFTFNLRRYTTVKVWDFARAQQTSLLSGQGLMDGARHVIGCRSTLETRVQNECDDVASISPRVIGYQLTPETRVRNACDDVASTIHQSLCRGTGATSSAWIGTRTR